MKIGIFGGTFNPIHNGHLKVIKDVKKELSLDIVYIIPTYKTPNKIFRIEIIKPKHRFEMVKRTVKEEGLPWLKVLDYEYKNKKISYTHKTIDYLKKKHPKDGLFLIMGEDRFSTFNSWKKVDEIKKNSKIVVYRRSHFINKFIPKDVIYLKDNFYNISSTNILKNIEWNNIPNSAKEYIAKNNLYLKSLAFYVLGEKRYEHSVAVASHSKRLSNRFWYLNKNKAYNIGMIHDLFKLHSDEWLRNYYKQNCPSNKIIRHLPNKALHGFVCSLWLKNEYMLKDNSFLNSIERHTLGHPDATKIDKIIFVADKISTDRKGDKVGKLRKLAYKNLDMTYEKIINELIRKLDSEGIEPHKLTLESSKKYNNQNNKNKKKIKVKKGFKVNKQRKIN